MTAVLLDTFNTDPALAREVLGACLDIPRWIETVAAGTPYADVEELRAAGARAADTITWAEVAAALDRHPRIGERTAAAAQSSTEAGWSRSEQAGVQASEQERLAAGNVAYEQRFGWIFLICAAGLSGGQILDALQHRLGNDPETEKPVVTAELRRIAALRLAKAVVPAVERLSTHVLDTSAGRPAAGIAVTLLSADGDRLGAGITDVDGRVGMLNESSFPAGDVRLVFETAGYFGADCFYPLITVDVRLTGARPHYHVPVLASTYSYSTYLGS